MYGSHTACIAIAESTLVVDAGPLQRVLEGERVDHGAQHAHLVGARAVHPARLVFAAAQDIARPDDHRELHAERGDFLDFAGERGERVEVDAGALGRRQRLPGELEHHAVEAGLVRRAACRLAHRSASPRCADAYALAAALPSRDSPS